MTPFGDRAVRFAVAGGAPRRRLFAELARLPNVADVVLAEDVGCVVFRTEPGGDDRAAVRAVLERVDEPGLDEAGAMHVVPVVYDGEDLNAVARTLGRTREDVIALHADAAYRVAMLGFLPGFAYLSGLRDELRLPRRPPRPRVPAGSVAIAASYTGIYPFASPGGWHLLGRAPSFAPFDARSGHAALAIGDVVTFVPTSEELPARAEDAPPALPAPSGPHVAITRAAGLALLVDGGRPGRMHEGVPPGGPLVRAAFERANASAGNAPDACAIELSGTFEMTARGGPIVVADDASGPVKLDDGARHVVSTEGRTRARYFAVAGGVDAPVVLGGRGALLACGIGAPLRRGAQLGTLARDGAPRAVVGAPLPAPSAAPPEEAVAIVEGPDAGVLPLDALLGRALRIGAASDRTGTRLEGELPAVPTEAHARRSTPMVLGAIELTPSGLVVLGPDHPTTGGYPVVAVVRASSLDPFFARPIGATVRFRR